MRSHRQFAYVEIVAADLYRVHIASCPLLLKGTPHWFGSKRRKWEGKEKKEKEGERKRTRKGRERRTSIRSSSYGPSGRGAKLSNFVNRFLWRENNKMV